MTVNKDRGYNIENPYTENNRYVKPRNSDFSVQNTENLFNTNMSKITSNIDELYFDQSSYTVDFIMTFPSMCGAIVNTNYWDKMSKIVDSICLKILTPQKLLNGNGNILQYYWVNAENVTCRTACSETLRDKIHGIIVQELQDSEYLIVYYGVRELVFAHLIGNEFVTTKKIKINDWISTAHFYDDKFSFCFVTGHNIIQEVHIDLKNKQFKFGNKSWCDDPSTLYCATILGQNWNSLIVLAGTALGDLLIWYPKYGNTNTNRSPVQHRLCGHNGVIFSITANLERQLIVTTSDDRSVRFWQAIQGESFQVTPGKQVFGHTARVFKSFIIEEDGITIIASAGEDSYLCLWSEDGTLLCKRKLNFGATIWDIDYCRRTKTIFTSGSDSNICKLNIKPYLSKHLIELESIEFPESHPEEYISKIKFLQSDVLIGLTNLNHIVYKIMDYKWKSLETRLNYKSCLFEVNEKFIVTAGYETISWFEFQLDQVVIVKSIKLPKSMIRSFHFVADGFVACDESGKCYRIDTNYEVVNTFNIPNCKEKWTTVCFVFGNIILAGDRCGNLHYFKHDSETNTTRLQTTLKLVHGNLGITNIYLLESQDDFIFVKSIGHDGTIKSIELSKHHDSLSIYHTYKTDVVWLERILNNRIFGFNDNYFVVWEKYNGIIHEFECGGRHRNWDVHFNYSNSIVTFVFIRNKKLCRNQFFLGNSENQINFVNYNWHIESCNSAAIVEIGELKYVISGGDDNLLKISQILNNDFINYYEIFSHISNIRAVITKKCSDGYLIISAGGRAQICTTKIFSTNNTIKIKELGNFMLKFNDSQRKRIRNTQEVDFNPETRFMCLASFDSKLYAGCSDGYIREFNIQLSEIIFVQSIFSGTCILNIAVLENHRIILTMGTDGNVFFWDLQNFTQLLKLKHHDSGVNCFDLFSVSQSEYKLISGGDDQSVTLSTFEILKDDREYKIRICRTMSSIELHSAQVTGIKFLDEHLAYSVGVDQIVNKISTKDLKPIASRFSCVSDPKGLQLQTKNNNFIVYGAGIEINDLL